MKTDRRVFAISVLCLIINLSACSMAHLQNEEKNEADKTSCISSKPIIEENNDTAEAYGLHGQLFACCDTEEEAEKIADIYSIELVDFSYGVAVFSSEEEPEAVITRGISE